MYKCENYFEVPNDIELPQCMYKMKPFFEIKEDLSKSYYIEDIYMKEKWGNFPELDAISNRQEKNLSKLEQLRCKIDSLLGNGNKDYIHCSIKASPCPKEELSHVIENLKEKIFGLGNLKNATKNVSSHVVISANPSHPPYGILLMIRSLQNIGIPVATSCSLHSSILQVDPILNRMFHCDCRNTRLPVINFRIHWKKDDITSMKINATKKTAIKGESNILRYISRLFPDESRWNYEANKCNQSIAEVDNWLDLIHLLIIGGTEERRNFLNCANERLATNKWLCRSDLSIADIFLMSAIMQLNMIGNLPEHVNQFLQTITSQENFSACYSEFKKVTILY